MTVHITGLWVAGRREESLCGNGPPDGPTAGNSYTGVLNMMTATDNRAKVALERSTCDACKLVLQVCVANGLPLTRPDYLNFLQAQGIQP